MTKFVLSTSAVIIFVAEAGQLVGELVAQGVDPVVALAVPSSLAGVAIGLVVRLGAAAGATSPVSTSTVEAAPADSRGTRGNRVVAHTIRRVRDDAARGLGRRPGRPAIG